MTAVPEDVTSGGDARLARIAAGLQGHLSLGDWVTRRVVDGSLWRFTSPAAEPSSRDLQRPSTIGVVDTPQHAFFIRQASTVDAPAVADVWLASFKATYTFPAAHSDEEVRGWIRDEIVPRPETFVAIEPGDGIVGFMSLDGGDVDHLYVRPDRFDRGIGSRFIELAKERRPHGLGLYTFQENERARAFYEQRGFRVEHLGNGEGNEEHQPDVRYVWRPTGAESARRDT